MFRGLSTDGYTRTHPLFFHYYSVALKAKLTIDTKKPLLSLLTIYTVLYVFATRTWTLKMVNLPSVTNGFCNVSILLSKYTH